MKLLHLLPALGLMGLAAGGDTITGAAGNVAFCETYPERC